MRSDLAQMQRPCNPTTLTTTAIRTSLFGAGQSAAGAAGSLLPPRAFTGISAGISGGLVAPGGDCPDAPTLAALAAYRHARRLRMASGSIEHIVRAGRVYVPVLDRTTGQQVDRLPSPTLMRLLQGTHGAMRALAFIDTARLDPDLRAQAEGQGIDLDDWEEWIRASASEA